MHESIKKDSRLTRIVFTSPWLPLFFIGVFALFILGMFVRFPRFIHLNHNVLLASNILLLLVITLRFFRYATRLSRNIRYGAEDRPAGTGVVSPLPVTSLREELEREGFSFDGSGYGEKRTRSYPAMTLVYGGLFLALLVGTYDNLRQFSAVLFQGEGAALSLDDEGTYFNVTKGPLASVKGLPRLQVKKLIHPSAQWSNGAADIALLDKNRAVITQAVISYNSKPVTYGGFEYRFGRTLCDVVIEISNKKYLEFSDSLKLLPLTKPEGPYTHYARFRGERLLWDVLFDPARKAFKLRGGKDKTKLVEGEIVFRRDASVAMGDYSVSIGGFSDWAEIHVIRHRHMALVYIGGALALIGALMRLLFSPQRVWLEEVPEGCRVWAVGGETKKRLKD